MARTTQAAQQSAALAFRMRQNQLDKRQSLVALQKLTQRFEQQIKQSVKQQDARPVRALNADAIPPPLPPAASSSRPGSEQGLSQQTTASIPAQTRQPVKPDDLPLDQQSFPAVRQAAQPPSKTAKPALSLQTQEQPPQRTQQSIQQMQPPLAPTAPANDTPAPGKLQIMRDAEGVRRITQALQDTRRQISQSGIAGSGGRDPGQGVNGQAQTSHNTPAAAKQMSQAKSHGPQSTQQQANAMAGVKDRRSSSASPRTAANPPDARGQNAV